MVDFVSDQEPVGGMEMVLATATEVDLLAALSVKAAAKPRFKLYELPPQYERLGLLLEESHGEVTEEIAVLMESLDDNLEAKVEGICRLMMEKRRYSEARHALGIKFITRSQVYDFARHRLQEYLGSTLHAMKKYSVETPGFYVEVYPDGDRIEVNIEPQKRVAVGNDEDPTDPLTDRANALVELLRERESYAAMRRAEAARLIKLAEADEESADDAKGELMDLLALAGVSKIETGQFVVRVQRNSQPSVRMTAAADLTGVPAEFVVQPPPPPATLDTKKVREAWKAAGSPEHFVAWEGEPIKDAWAVSETNPDGIVRPSIVVDLGKHVRVK